MTYHGIAEAGQIGCNMRNRLRKYLVEIKLWQRRMNRQENEAKIRNQQMKENKTKINNESQYKENKKNFKTRKRQMRKHNKEIVKQNKENIKENHEKIEKLLECNLQPWEYEYKGIEKCKKFISRRRIKLIINRLYARMRNIVNELHKRTAIFLCSTFERILIPEFKTSQMIRNKKMNTQSEHYKELKENLRELWEKLKSNEITKEELIKNRTELYKEYYSKENVGKSQEQIRKEIKESSKFGRLKRNVKFVLNMLSHYRFKQYLFSKGEEYDCLVKEVTEEYTSKACTKCGHLSNNYKGRTKICTKCNLHINRDVNGSRNILLKNIGEFLEELRL